MLSLIPTFLFGLVVKATVAIRNTLWYLLIDLLAVTVIPWYLGEALWKVYSNYYNLITFSIVWVAGFFLSFLSFFSLRTLFLSSGNLAVFFDVLPQYIFFWINLMYKYGRSREKIEKKLTLLVSSSYRCTVRGYVCLWCLGM